jgi:hypothetical protein
MHLYEAEDSVKMKQKKTLFLRFYYPDNDRVTVELKLL